MSEVAIFSAPKRIESKLKNWASSSITSCIDQSNECIAYLKINAQLIKSLLSTNRHPSQLRKLVVIPCEGKCIYCELRFSENPGLRSSQHVAAQDIQPNGKRPKPENEPAV
jgi:hypothetical protein